MAIKKKRAITVPDVEDIILDAAWVDRVVDVLVEELQMEELGIEEKDTLQRIVALSVGMYMMELRESVNRTTRLYQ